MSAEYRGNPCHETASAPTTRYSTLFEFKHSINSRKSLLKGIGVGSLSQFEEYIGSLLGGHLSARLCIGDVGFLKGVENADDFLHGPILRCLFDCCGETRSAQCRRTVLTSRVPLPGRAERFDRQLVTGTSNNQFERNR